MANFHRPRTVHRELKREDNKRERANVRAAIRGDHSKPIRSKRSRTSVPDLRVDLFD